MVKNFARSTGVHYFSFISSFVCYRLPPCSTMSDFTSRTWPLEPSWGPFPSFGPGRETRHSWTHSLFLSFALKGLILNRHSLFIHSRLRYLNLILEAIVAIKSVQAKKQHCRIQEDSFVQSDQKWFFPRESEVEHLLFLRRGSPCNAKGGGTMQYLVLSSNWVSLVQVQ